MPNASKCYWNIFPGGDETVYLRFTVNDDKQKTNGKRASIINWNSGLMTSLDSPGQFRVLVGFLKSEFDFVQEIIDDYPQQVFLQEKDGLPF